MVKLHNHVIPKLSILHRSLNSTRVYIVRSMHDCWSALVIPFVYRLPVSRNNTPALSLVSSSLNKQWVVAPQACRFLGSGTSFIFPHPCISNFNTNFLIGRSPLTKMPRWCPGPPTRGSPYFCNPLHRFLIFFITLESLLCYICFSKHFFHCISSDAIVLPRCQMPILCRPCLDDM